MEQKTRLLSPPHIYYMQCMSYGCTIGLSIYPLQVKGDEEPKLKGIFFLFHSKNTDNVKKILAMPNVYMRYTIQEENHLQPLDVFSATRTFRAKKSGRFVSFPTPFSIYPITRRIDFQISIRKKKIVGFIFVFFPLVSRFSCLSLFLLQEQIVSISLIQIRRLYFMSYI